jgi:hypothetical protein
MVVGFAKDRLQLSEAELSHLTLDIREGDMSVVLREYEKEIKVRKTSKKPMRITVTYFICRVLCEM